MRREGEREIIKKIKPSAAWHRSPTKQAKPQLVLGHVSTTRVCKDSAEGPSPPQEWGLDLTQSQDLPSAPPAPSFCCAPA